MNTTLKRNQGYVGQVRGHSLSTTNEMRVQPQFTDSGRGTASENNYIKYVTGHSLTHSTHIVQINRGAQPQRKFTCDKRHSLNLEENPEQLEYGRTALKIYTSLRRLTATECTASQQKLHMFNSLTTHKNQITIDYQLEEIQGHSLNQFKFRSHDGPHTNEQRNQNQGIATINSNQIT